MYLYNNNIIVCAFNACNISNDGLDFKLYSKYMNTK